MFGGLNLFSGDTKGPFGILFFFALNFAKRVLNFFARRKHRKTVFFPEWLGEEQIFVGYAGFNKACSGFVAFDLKV